MSTLPPFEELARMAREEPEKLEQLRQKAVREVIEAAPEESRKRLEGLQFRIDGIRRTSKNPTQATIKLSTMMKESFEELRKNLNALTGKEPIPDLTETTEAKADVLQFKSKKDDESRKS